MIASINDKVELNKVTHSVRAAQAVLQYGVGAMVDFPDQTLITAAPETWNGKQMIYDDRFAKALGVDFFALPTKISYSRFPEWYFCPKCRRFQPINGWVSEYNKKSKENIYDKDPYMVKHMKCVKCNQDLVAARIVTICEKGHINDFPWIEWVHVRSKKPICKKPSLIFKTGTSSTEGLEGLVVACECGATTTLMGAFSVDCFKKLDKDNGSTIFRCKGNHPHKHIQEECLSYPRTVQRGASSVYFPLIYSSLVIPPYTDKLISRIEKSKNFFECEATLGKVHDMREEILNKYFKKWVEGIAIEVGISNSNVEKILKRKWFDEGNKKTDVASIEYRSEEYEALNGEVSTSKGVMGDFSRLEINKELYQDRLSYIKSISLINKIRVVNALVGFSRINPVSSIDSIGFVSVKEKETNWYPAYEVKGEGIFIEFNNEDIRGWIMKNPEIADRANIVNNNYLHSYFGPNKPRLITPKFLLLHTISHLLIKQLSFECGYSIANLSERLYCSERNEGKEMSGVFIYTASGDSEGTLGGLVRQGRPDAFPGIFKRAINNAKMCSNDPVCILSRGQGRESLNLAACHACVLLPETCCEERNAFLDRGLVVGTFDNPKLGFYSDL